MTFQFIVEYVDPEHDLPFDFGCTDEEYEVIAKRRIANCIKSKRIRAKNGVQAIKIFQQKYPELEIIGWR